MFATAQKMVQLIKCCKVVKLVEMDRLITELATHLFGNQHFLYSR